MRVNFTKMHGLGNDFIVFDAPVAGFAPSRELVQRLAARHTGIGFDQALLLEAPRQPGSSAFYRIFNADGAEVEQCGNGARCIAALLNRRGATPGAAMTLESAGGLVHARIAGDKLVAIDLGIPNFSPEALPFEAPSEAQVYLLEVEGEY